MYLSYSQNFLLSSFLVDWLSDLFDWLIIDLSCPWLFGRIDYKFNFQCWARPIFDWILWTSNFASQIFCDKYSKVCVKLYYRVRKKRGSQIVFFYISACPAETSAPNLARTEAQKPPCILHQENTRIGPDITPKPGQERSRIGTETDQNNPRKSAREKRLRKKYWFENLKRGIYSSSNSND